MNDNCITLIEELIQIRKDKGLTQRDLSKISDIAQPAIARFEKKTHTPTLETFINLADALGYKVVLKTK